LTRIVKRKKDEKIRIDKERDTKKEDEKKM